MRKLKRMVTALMVVGLLLSLPPMQVFAESDFPTVLAETKKGVVQIYGLANDGVYLSSWVGTGFAVGEEGEDSDVFLTNWHVVTGDGQFEQSDVRIWILQENCYIDAETYEPDPDRSIACEVLKTTTGYPDYAIIRAVESISGYKALPLLSSEDIQDGTTVYALGYPAVVGGASASHYGIDDITSTNGIISQHMQYAYADNTWVLMHTAQISGGNSGGPLITEAGAVIGLNTYGFGESEENMNRYCAVYIDYVMEGLDELDISYDIYSEAEDKDGSFNVMYLVLIAGVAVVAVIAVILWTSQQKKKKMHELAMQQEQQRLHQEELYRREKLRQQEEVRRRQEEQQRQERMIKARLRLNGATVYPVLASGGTVGRDKSCMIVLPENAPGVSRVHCKLEFRGDTLVMTDMNSTYGTYIHGKRVPPNTPVALKQYSSFSLGSDQVTLTVC